MLYDVFICHAFEDKETFVRPLADALRASHVEVWYDEFELKVGDSIRRAIDHGLTQSRFGIVVLSPQFFAKNWPQYELDGLVGREMSGAEKVVLPVWHQANHKLVSEYSPSLAARFAADGSKGLDNVISELLAVIRPQGSPLIVARDILIEWGASPPVVTDPYWLNVVEASNRIPGYGAEIPSASHWGRWCFPLPPKDGENPFRWGERLAWTAMQHAWCEAADAAPISVTTPPAAMLEFIESQPGLLETCLDYPVLAAEYAPQLTIPGWGGQLEQIFEEAYQQSLIEQKRLQDAGSINGTALTTNGAVPDCDVEWALRHPHFGTYTPLHIAENYFHAAGMFGPEVSYHDDGVHVIWLLSAASEWLPAKIRVVLQEGMKESHRRWVWGEFLDSRRRGEWDDWGALGNELYEAYERGSFIWTDAVERDVRGLIAVAIEELLLPEDLDVLYNRFRLERYVERNVEANRKLPRYRGSKRARKMSRGNDPV